MNIYFVKDIEPGADLEMEEGDALSGGCCVYSIIGGSGGIQKHLNF